VRAPYIPDFIAVTDSGQHVNCRDQGAGYGQRGCQGQSRATLGRCREPAWEIWTVALHACGRSGTSGNRPESLDEEPMGWPAPL
jgi:hypothetical protein